jgi:ribosomal protein L18E
MYPEDGGSISPETSVNLYKILRHNISNDVIVLTAKIDRGLLETQDSYSTIRKTNTSNL